MSSTIWTHVERAVIGAIVVAGPLLIADIPASWQAMTIGAAISVVWGLVSDYLKSVIA